MPQKQISLPPPMNATTVAFFKPILARVIKPILAAAGMVFLSLSSVSCQSTKSAHQVEPVKGKSSGKASDSNSGPTADPSEFTADDFPETGNGTNDKSGSNKVPAGKKPATRRSGLFFGGSASETHDVQDENQLAARDMATIREDLLALEPLRWPVKGQLSSHFGDRKGHFHRGIDIRAPLGTVIVPAAQGKVIFAGRKKKYGKTVLIQHRFHQTLYAHLSSINVRRGEWVDLTQVIGKVGRSGNARGVHLHFEVIDGSANPLDPLAVVTRSQSLRLAKVNTAKGSRTRNTRIQ